MRGNYRIRKNFYDPVEQNQVQQQSLTQPLLVSTALSIVTRIKAKAKFEIQVEIQ